MGVTPALTQGLFLAPTVVKGALKGAVFAANIYEKLGFKSIGIRKNFYDCPRENALIMQMESIAGDE